MAPSSTTTTTRIAALLQEAIQPEADICKEFGAGIWPIAFPTAGEWKWSPAVRTFLYGFAMMYFFLGVSIAADIFMGSIEVITSRRKQRMLPNGRVITVHIWNDTVANLTLMALGSSAPEILLAVTELIGKGMYSGPLGPATIVGSASFNLLMIVALCIVVIPSNETRKVNEVPVFLITVIFMFIAYIWLVVIVAVISPGIVTIWEGVVTVLLLPILVVISYLADIGWFGEIGKHLEVRTEHIDRVCELLEEDSRAVRDAVRVGLAADPEIVGRLAAPTAQDLAEFKRMVKKHVVSRKSRAARRVDATRAFTGGKKVAWSGPQKSDENLIIVAGLAGASIQEVPLALPKGSGKNLVQFSAESQQLCDDVLKKPILFHRSGDCSAALTVKFEVVGPRESTVVQNEEIVAVGSTKQRSSRKSWFAAAESVQATRFETTQCKIETGTCRFEAGQDVAQQIIVRPEGVSLAGASSQFMVQLTSSQDDAANPVDFGHIQRTTVVLSDAAASGKFSFAYERLLIQGAAENQTIQVMVQRTDGCHGNASCSYHTEKLTAVPGFDFTEVTGKIEFEHGITEAFIEIEILPKSRTENQDEFLLIMTEVEGAEFNVDSDGGADSEILTIGIGPRELTDARVDEKLVKFLDSKLNFDELRLGNAEYKEQFTSAMYCNGSYEDQKEAGILDWVFHILALPWKLVFMFIPPTAYCHGWLCFYMSLVFIGALTALIGDLATLFGCVLSMPDLLTAISFVALGTSMPDLFASKTAATQDPTADASIVNVTGSNSVNVFLGLGLPWTAGAIYWNMQDEWNDVWEFNYPDVAATQRASGKMVFVVPSGDLVFSVVIFCICACLALVILLVRRRKIGAELGGPVGLKFSAAGSFVLMWFIYIAISGWWSLRQDKADSTEITAMFVGCGVPVLISLVVFFVCAARVPRHWRPSMDCEDEAAPAKSQDEGTTLMPEVTESPPEAIGNEVEDLKKDPPAEDPSSDISLEIIPAAVKIEPEPVVDETIVEETPPKTMVSWPPIKDVVEDCQVASESQNPSPAKDKEDVGAEVAVTQSTDMVRASCCMACCLTPGGNYSNLEDTKSSAPIGPSIGIVSVRKSVDADGTPVQQYNA